MELDHGEVYGEPVARIRAQGKIVGRAIQVASITANDDAGKVSGSGSFRFGFRANFSSSLKVRRSTFNRIQRLRQIGLCRPMADWISLSPVTGHWTNPHIQAQGKVAALVLNGEPVGRTANYRAHCEPRSHL